MVREIFVKVSYNLSNEIEETTRLVEKCHCWGLDEENRIEELIFRMVIEEILWPNRRKPYKGK